MGFTVRGINHLGLAAKDPEKCRWFFCTALGLKHLGDELVREQKTMTVMIDSSRGKESSRSRLEIVSPEAGTNDSPIAKFLEKRGAGIHHVALTVDSIEAAIAHLESVGVRMVDRVARPGAHQTKIAFIHPESTGGILVELVQESGS